MVEECHNTEATFLAIAQLDDRDGGGDEAATSAAEDDPSQTNNPRIVLCRIETKSTTDSGEGRIILGDTFEVETTAFPRNSLQRVLLAAATSEGDFVAVIESSSSCSSGQCMIQRYRSKGAQVSDSTAVSLPMYPVCMFILDSDTVFLGFDGLVAWVDFSAPVTTQVAAYAELYRSKNNAKPYDMFTITKNKRILIAVDDTEFPFFADTFRITNNYRKDDSNTSSSTVVPVHESHWTLPALINGRYTHATVLSNDSLILASQFGCRNRSGRSLQRISVELFEQQQKKTRSSSSSPAPNNDKYGQWYDYDWREEDRYNNASNSKTNEQQQQPRTIEEYLGRVWHRVVTFATHHEGKREERILVAAGDRGLLVLPSDFNEKTRGRFVSPGRGTVVDICCINAIVGGNNVVAVWLLFEPSLDQKNVAGGCELIKLRQERLLNRGDDLPEKDSQGTAVVELRIPLKGKCVFVQANGTRFFIPRKGCDCEDSDSDDL